MSKYLLDKFLFTIDRDPELVERYRKDARGTVTWWEAEQAGLLLNCHSDERSTWQAFTDAERDALATHDYVKLFERDYAEPLAFQREFASRLSHWSLPYPDIST